MLKRFEVRNYKNFKENFSIEFDKAAGYQFNPECLINGLIGKMIIYGKNATGKTNLGWAIMDIRTNLIGLNRRRGTSSFLNVDSESNCAYFKYEFELNEKNVIYEYEKSSQRNLLTERLWIDGDSIFSIDFEANVYDFSGLKIVNAETLIVDRFKQAIQEETDNEETIPFLRWIIMNTPLSRDSVLYMMDKFIKNMNLSIVSEGIMALPSIIEEKYVEYLSKEHHLAELTEFLNRMDIPCELTILESIDGTKNLYFDKKKPIHFFSNASSGTKSLFRLYLKLSILASTSSFLYMDEFDAFYHYEMAEKVILFLKEKYPKCQMIFTTHNTNLMSNRLMRPDCLFILSQSGKLTALCDATQRELREGHNLEKMYISGEFEKYE
ncbi:MAG: ATP-binding protein [Bacillota bacterium]|nr:ATP-binding protein [Bacillota bacterium]